MKKILLAALFITTSCSWPFRDESLTSKNDSWSGENYSIFSQNPVAKGKKYMVSSSEKLASEAGENILKMGGSAVDAAIAMQMVLNVIEPHSSGIGGGLFLLYYDAKTKSAIYFNGRETSPMEAHSKMFLDKDGKPREFYDIVGGGLSVATPGALKALKEAHIQYGRLPWKTLFQPAISIANNGFAMNEKIHGVLLQLPYLKKFEGMSAYFNNDSTPKQVGAVIKNKELAKTMSIIARYGIKPFYEGKIASDIVKAVRNSKVNPGVLSLQDLKNYNITTGNLVCSSYRLKYKVCSMPMPSSGGITLLQALGILENFDLSKIKPSSLEAVHLISEASKLAYADRNKYLADVSNLPISQMLDKGYLHSRSKLISTKKAMKNVAPGQFINAQTPPPINVVQEKPSTTHVSIVDKYGNAVSMTSSIEYLFGSVLMVDGFVLNNQLTDFSIVPEIDGVKVANRIEPLKRPRSSMTPTFVFDQDNKLLMVIGSPGGPRIIQFVLKAIIGKLDWGFDVQSAISLPNHVFLSNTLELEKRTELEMLKPQLEKMGYNVVVTDITSGLHGISVESDAIYGGADPRRGGIAIGK